MRAKSNYEYYRGFLKETHRIIREQDQSTRVGEIVRETESHVSDLEEKEKRAMTQVNDELTDTFDLYAVEEMEGMDKIPTEDKIIMSREEDFPVKELTPGEISRIVTNALRDLPDSLTQDETSLSEVLYDVAYAVMNQMTE